MKIPLHYVSQNFVSIKKRHPVYEVDVQPPNKQFKMLNYWNPKIVFSILAIILVAQFGFGQGCANNVSSPNGCPTAEVGVIDLNIGIPNNFCVNPSDGGCGTFRFLNIPTGGSVLSFNPAQGCGVAGTNLCLYESDGMTGCNFLGVGSSLTPINITPTSSTYEMTICRPGNGPVSIHNLNMTTSGPPVITCPVNEIVECVADIMPDVNFPVVTTNCTMGNIVTFTGPTLVAGAMDCPGAEYEVTYTVADDCGQTAECIQIFTITNDQPTITCPSDEVVKCVADIMPDVTLPVVTGSCTSGNLITFNGPTLVSGTMDCSGAKYEVTYTFADDCSRTAECTQTFTLENDPPTITCPANVGVECGDSTDPIDIGMAIATSGCGTPAVIFIDVFAPACGSTGVIERTWTATDNCGQTSTCLQTITIFDTDQPILPAAPAPIIVECDAIPIPEVLMAIDACEGMVTGVATDVRTDGACANAYTITRTWRFDDECGNFDELSQEITVEDTTPPVVTCAEFTESFEGCPEVVVPNTPTGEWFPIPADGMISTTVGVTFTGTLDLSGCVSDNCSDLNEMEFSLVDSYFGNNTECLVEIINEYAVRDAYGNVADDTFIFSGKIEDNKIPIIATPLGSLDLTINITDQGACPEGFLGWTCYFQTSAITPLSIDVALGGIDLGNHPGPNLADISDNFNLVQTFCQLGTPIVTPCEMIREVTWIAVDGCGNESVPFVQTFTILDKEPPVVTCDEFVETFNLCPDGLGPNTPNGVWIPIGSSGGINTAVGGSSTAFLDLTTCVSDICTDLEDIEYTLHSSYEENRVPGCSVDIINEFSIRDACENVALGRVVFRGQIRFDGALPVITCPDGGIVECASDIPIITVNDAIASVECGTPSLSLTGPVIVGNPDCPLTTYTYTYTVTDDCGRTASCDQVFTIENDPPTITCPANEIVECVGDIMPDVTLPVFTTSCTLGSTVTFSGPTLVSGVMDCPGAKYEVRYTFADDCSRTAECTQTFTIENNPPTITCPADEVVECVSDIMPDVTLPVVTTSCALGSAVTFSGPTLVSGTMDCSGSIYEVTYTFADDCSRTAECTQTFTIENDPPTITCPADEVVECVSDIMPDITLPVVSTSCMLGNIVTFTGPILIDGQMDCPGARYEVTYTVEDGCGRTTSCDQIFTIENDPPTITCPANEIVECVADIMPDVTLPVVTTSCTLGSIVTFTGPTLVSGAMDCPGSEYEVRYTVADDCSRTAECIQTFTIENDPPTIICPAGGVVECVSDIMPDVTLPVVTTSCALGSTVTFTGPTLVSGVRDCPGSEYEVRYTVADDCGRTAECIQTFTIENDPPTIICPAGGVVECVSEIMPDVTLPVVTTSCALGSTVTFSGPTMVAGAMDCPGAKYEVRYTVADNCGRTAECTQTFTIENDPPTITCPTDMTVECFADINVDPMDATVVTSCGLGFNTIISGPVQNGQSDCFGTTYTYTYTTTDDCGRVAASCDQVFTIQNAGPILTCPTPITVECAEDIEVDPSDVGVVVSCGSGFTAQVFGPNVYDGTPDCPGARYVYRYLVEDDCGRISICERDIFIDNAGPTISCPGTQIISCADEIILDLNEITNYATSCGQEVDLTSTDPVLITGLSNCSGAVYFVEYTVTDQCGRSASCSINWQIENEAPTVTCLPARMVDCPFELRDEQELLEVKTACELGYRVEVNISEFQHNCPGAQAAIEYTIFDDCGRSVQCIQNWELISPPFRVIPPPTVRVACIDDYTPNIDDAEVESPCGLDVVKSEIFGPLYDEDEPLCAGSVINYLYSFYDECGRMICEAQAVIIDPTAISNWPEFEDTRVECDKVPDPETAVTICGQLINLRVTEEIITIPGRESYRIIRTYEGRDACGELFTFRQRIVVICRGDSGSGGRREGLTYDGLKMKGDLVLFPNPVISSLTVSLDFPDFEKVSTLIYSSFGEVVYRDSNSATEKKTIDVSGFGPGLYHLVVIGNDEVIRTEKFIVQ